MFDLLLHSRAQKAYNRLDAKHKRQINRALEAVRQDPLGAPGVARLQGELAGLYRARAGDYRIVFEIRMSEHQIFVLAIGPRGDIYK